MDPPFEAVFPATPCGTAPTARFACSNAPVLVIWDDLVRVSGSGWQEVRMPHGAKLRIARNMTGVLVKIDGLEVTLAR